MAVVVSDVLEGKRIAIVVTDGFEQVEMAEPRGALVAAGARTDIVSPKGGRVKAWAYTEWGDEFAVDVAISEADPEDYDALLLPGGVMSPDKLRVIPEVLDFVRAMVRRGKPVAAICHGPWTLIDAGVVDGRTMTSWPSLRSDLANAGADWVDEEVVVDRGLVTSRRPADIPAFNRRMLEQFGEARDADEAEVPRPSRPSAPMP